MPVTLVVAGPPSLRARAEAAGFTVAGEVADYTAAVELIEESGATAILVAGVPHAEVDASVPTVVVAEEHEMRDVVSLGAFTVVPSDAGPALVAAAVATAEAFARAVRQARSQAAEAHEEVETRKLTERAKGILMKRLNLTEDEAYRKLQKASQNENRKLRDVADSIVRTEKILTENAPAKGAHRNRTAG